MRHLDIAWRPNLQGHARTGIVVPRFGNSAVARNRLRRRVREILRREVLGSLPAVDIVVRAKPAAYVASFAVLRAELTDGAARVSR
jgi:ribonuclease P protein component